MPVAGLQEFAVLAVAKSGTPSRTMEHRLQGAKVLVHVSQLGVVCVGYHFIILTHAHDWVMVAAVFLRFYAHSRIPSLYSALPQMRGALAFRYPATCERLSWWQLF